MPSNRNSASRPDSGVLRRIGRGGGEKGKRKGYEEEKERGTRRRVLTFSLQAGVERERKRKRLRS